MPNRLRGSGAGPRLAPEVLAVNPLMRELYQETIMGHNRAPRNFRVMEGADGQARGNNPLCGDSLDVYVRLDGEELADVAFHGDGCAISRASASMMTDAVKGRTRDEARAMYEEFHKLVTGEGEPDMQQLGKMKVFAGVKEFPARVKCAALAWRTLVAALEQEREVSTE